MPKEGFNSIERVESFNMDFAFYRGLDPILGRWYQVDPEAEMYANMSTYCGMNNNPTNEVDPLGDSPVHVGAAIVGAGINIYNNWSSIVKNPWSAIGYAGTGALAGVVSVSGGVAAAAKITAIGNLATDAISGNAPDIKSVNDAFNYGVKTVGNALDVAGAGKIANAGIKGLQKLGLDLIPEAANIVAEAATEKSLGFVTHEWYKSSITVGSEIVINGSRSYAGQMAIGSLMSNPVRGAVNGQLGASANGGAAPTHGGTAHNDRIDQWVKKLQNNNGVQNIRKNQQQVDVNGKLVGKNRPDLQFDYKGKHHNLEWDTKTASSIKHKKVVTANDPKAISKFWKLLK